MESSTSDEMVHFEGNLVLNRFVTKLADSSKGDNISKTDPIKYSWYQTITEREQLVDISSTIYYCTLEIAPKRRSSGKYIAPSPS